MQGFSYMIRKMHVLETFGSADDDEDHMFNGIHSMMHILALGLLVFSRFSKE